MTEKRKPWFKFYVDSWRADELLRMCSLQARGMWVEMLAIMHKATPYGHLLVNGSPMRLDDLARLVGVPLKEAKAAIDELERKSVFSRTPEGVVFSRKMVRDEIASQEGRENIRKRFPLRGDDSEPESPPNRVPCSEADSTDDRGQKEKPEAKASGKKTRSTPVRSDFHPKPETIETIIAAGTRPEDVEHERIAFIDRNIARGERYVDHDAAFRNWCRNSRKFARQNSPAVSGQRPSPQGGPSLVRAAMAVIAANGGGGLRPDGVPGDQAPDRAGAGGDSFAFEGFDQTGGPGPGHPGIDEMPAGDEVARKAG